MIVQVQLPAAVDDASDAAHGCWLLSRVGQTHAAKARVGLDLSRCQLSGHLARHAPEQLLAQRVQWIDALGGATRHVEVLACEILA